MSINLFLDNIGGNTIAALADGKRLLEYHIEKSNANQIVGNIYKGRVETVISGMQAAFVNVGLQKNGYLYVGDTLIDKSLLGDGDIPTTLDIKEGDEIMVQAVKDPSGTKGARLSTYLSLAGKYVVYAPSLKNCSVSRKITDEETKERLITMLDKIKRKQGGFIARTASEYAKPSEIKIEAKNLLSQYEEILKNYEKVSVGDEVYSESDLVMRMVRDVVTTDVEKIIVADKKIYERLRKLPKTREKIIKNKLEFYNGKQDLFKTYGLEEDVESLLHNRVNLSTGAYLIIDKTEALTVIDVNTGSFIGEEKLEDTVFKTNILAAEEIARQVRLRNIGGIVVVDFIDMDSDEHREKLLETLEEHLKKDRLKCNVIGMTGLGIVQFTRRKKRKELSAFLNKPCPYCKGDGRVLSDDYVAMKIRTGLLDLFSNDFRSAIIDLNVDVCHYILEKGALKKDIEKYFIGKRIYLVPHKTFHQEFFKIKGDNAEVLSVPDNAILLY